MLQGRDEIQGDNSMVAIFTESIHTAQLWIRFEHMWKPP